MICPKCGRTINEENYCVSCHMKVATYQKIVNTSAWLYNQGLQKAKVRDLTGAIDFLKRSLKFNKRNIDARNLLGLIYFEIGEVVLALEQWVISKNFQSTDNLAENYIHEIQENQSTLSKYNSAIKKYNQSLDYIKQNNSDLAVIQLKKVISINPHFVRAYCLLSLLYIHHKEYEKAKKTLLKVLAIDKNNYTALRYLDELVDNDNETLEEEWLPNEDRNSRGFHIKFLEQGSYGFQIAYVLLGLLIGAGLMYFLVTNGLMLVKDGQINDLKTQLEIMEEDHNNGVAEYETLIDQLREQTDQLQAQIDELTDQESYVKSVDAVLQGTIAYFSGEQQVAAEALLGVEIDALNGTDAQILYETIKEETFEKVSASYYVSGYSDYNNARYQSCIENMEMALKYGEDNEYTVRAYYYKARSHQYLGQDEMALEAFRMVVNNYPNANPYAEWANGFINELTD